MSHVGNKGVLVGVVAAHAALLWLWSPRVPVLQAPTRRATVVIIALPAPPAAPEPERDERFVPRSSPRKTKEARPTTAQRVEGMAISSPASPSTGPLAAAAAASQPASAPKALDLVVRPRDVLRPGPRGEALNDPRANAPRLSAEERMAQTLGTDTRLRDEIRPDGSVRIRQGSSCFDARESRAAGLDPYNSAIAPKPRLMSAC
jgi:hypothetical protein